MQGGVAQFVRTAAKATGSCQPSLGVVITIAVAVPSSISEMTTGSGAFGHVPVGACASTYVCPGGLSNGTARRCYQTHTHTHTPGRKTWRPSSPKSFRLPSAISKSTLYGAHDPEPETPMLCIQPCYSTPVPETSCSLQTPKTPYENEHASTPLRKVSI